MAIWQLTPGYEKAHAYDSEAALVPICGSSQGSPELERQTVASVVHPCRRCQMVLGSRRARAMGESA
jgi:hypothetical protein